LSGPRGLPGGEPAGDRPGDGAHAPDPRPHVRDEASVLRRPALRRGPGARAAPGPHTAVAARGASGIRAPGVGGVHGVRERVPSGPPARTRYAPGDTGLT